MATALRVAAIDRSVSGGVLVIDLAGVTVVAEDLSDALPGALADLFQRVGVVVVDGDGLCEGASGESGRAPRYATVADAVAEARPITARRRAVADFPVGTQAAAMARRFTDRACKAWSLGDLRLDAALTVSELVENVTRHCGGACSVALELGQRVLAIGVADGCDRPPTLRRPEPEEPGGRGLVITDAIARRWGYRRVTGGKVVWALLTLPQDVVAVAESVASDRHWPGVARRSARLESAR